MTKAIGALLAVQLALVAPLSGQDGIDSLFPERPSGPVTDVAGVLDAATVARLDGRLQRLRDSTGAEVAVVVLPGIAEHAAADVGLAIGRRWQVGGAFPVGDPRRNAGAVLLVVPRTPERRGAVDLRSGTGSEGFLTDARAGRILDAMLPALRDDDYAAALELGTSRLADLFARSLGSTDTALVAPRTRRPAGLLVGFLIVAIVLALVLVMVGAGRGPPRGGRRRRGGWGDAFGPAILGGGIGRGGFGGGGFGGGGFGGGGFGGFGGGGGFSGGGAGRGF